MISDILKDISNPRLDICFLFKNFSQEIDKLYNFLISKQMMCVAFGMNDNKFYKSNYLNNISNDLDFLCDEQIAILSNIEKFKFFVHILQTN